MKLKRDEFKAMLKECILELVQEGKIFQGTGTPTMAPGVGEQEVRMPSPQGEAGRLGVTPNTRLSEAVRVTTQFVSKGDPSKAALFEGIIADTARTTLQKQLSVQITGGGEIMGGTVLPEDKAFDQAQLGAFAAKDRWAMLAFGGKGKIGIGR
jgi:hypothetical protein